METRPTNPIPLRLHVEESHKHFTKVRDAKDKVSGKGHFSFRLKVTALTEVLYIPLSIASGKKPTGFTYQIEGTAEASIVTTDISLRDVKESGVTQIQLGTIAYVKIPKDMTAVFHISIVMKGKVGKEYTIAITHLRYKYSPNDAQYQNYTEEIRMATLKFH